MYCRFHIILEQIDDRHKNEFMYYIIVELEEGTRIYLLNMKAKYIKNKTLLIINLTNLLLKISFSL